MKKSSNMEHFFHLPWWWKGFKFLHLMSFRDVLAVCVSDCQGTIWYPMKPFYVPENSPETWACLLWKGKRIYKPPNLGVPYSFKRGVGFVEKLEVDIDQLAMKFHDMMIRLQSHHPKRTPTYPWSTPQASHMKGVPSYFKSCWLGGPGSVLVVCWKILRTIVLMVQKSQTTTWDGAKTLSK